MGTNKGREDIKTPPKKGVKVHEFVGWRDIKSIEIQEGDILIMFAAISRSREKTKVIKFANGELGYNYFERKDQRGATYRFKNTLSGGDLAHEIVT